ncbi:fasciclin-like arabinogalactan protein 12 [Punica granatum]|uniref:FAS1 domain-containing protein n=2 Tax=Punica granatum TaxID=22663 RepID=A0A218W8B7_PUNGR|nr:fasciclin-like arabinogalactan protein 12 [Punica granatum]OWM68886.1 hypothetical protein CDL15_Pgr025073 [Punica granatum]PKI51984.1 hypothetical protein CRG98_027636 [Punica granatum]
MATMKQLLCPSLALALLIISTSTSAQLSPDSPPSPTDITKVLEKAGHFTALLRLLRTTHMTGQILTQLKASANGLTFLAPTDAAFSTLKAGALNTLTDKQQVQLVQFHVISVYLPKPAFQTVSNPLRTIADGLNDGKFPLNVTVGGDGSIKLSTGIDEASVGTELYSDGQLAMYEVDKVLQPPSIFPPAPPPQPQKAAEEQPTSVVGSSAAPRSLINGVVEMAATVGIAALGAAVYL